MAKYTVFESCNMASTKYAARIFDVVATTDIENGTFGYIDGVATGETVTYNFKPGTKSGEFVVVADNPAWTEENFTKVSQRKDKYIIPAGTKFRAREVKINDTFGITIEGVTTATKATLTAVTNFITNKIYLTIDSTTGKLVASDTAAASSVAMEATVERKRVSGATLVTPAHTYGYSADIYEARVTKLA